VLYGGNSELRVDVTAWPVDRLEALGRMLLQAYPLASDPDTEGRIRHMDVPEHLRQLRDRTTCILLHREDHYAQLALERLAASDPGLGTWLHNHRRMQQAHQLLDGLPAVGGGPGLPVPEAVRLLEDADYRLIRSPDDLLECVTDSRAKQPRKRVRRAKKPSKPRAK
jgi:hypothetical protein